MSSKPLKLLAKSGPLEGQIVPLREGLTLGRDQAEICLMDPKVSGLHAKVLLEKGNWILQDLGSKNKIKVGQKRLERLALKVDLRFEIGSSLFEVFEAPFYSSQSHPSIKNRATPKASQKSPPKNEQKERPSLSKKAKLPELPDDSFFDAPPVNPERNDPEGMKPPNEINSRPPKRKAPDSPPPLQWNLSLAKEIEKLAKILKPELEKIEARSVYPLTPMVRLNFRTGPQLDQSYFLAYGPRDVGADSPTLKVFEPQAPDICFTIRQNKERIEIVIPDPSRVKMNNQSIREKLLERGDIISIGATEIEVELVKE